MGWKRGHCLVILLIFLKHDVGQGWSSQNVQPQKNWPVHNPFSLRGIQSSVLEAPVTGSSPVEEVAPKTVPGKSLSASRSRFSLSYQNVKGGFSSSYEPMSHTQSAPSVFDGISSLLQLQGSSGPKAQNVVSQSADRRNSYSWSSLNGSGLQGVSAQLASTPVRGGSSSGLSNPSQSTSSPSTPDSLSNLNFSPLDASGPISSQSSSNIFTVGSPNSSGLQLGGTSSLLSKQSSSSAGSSRSSRRFSTANSQGSSGPQLTQLVGLFTQPPSDESQRTSGSSYVKLAASPLGFSQATSGQSSHRQYTLSSQSRVGTQLAAPHQYVPGQGSSYSLSVQPQGTTSQYAPASSLGAKRPMSSQYYSPTSYSKYTLSSQSRAGTKLAGSSPMPIQSGSTLTDGSSLRLQGTSTQYVPAPLDTQLPVYRQTAQSGSLSLSKIPQWQTSSSWLQGFPTSGTVSSQSSSPSQGFKVPSRFSTSAVSSGQNSFTQEGSDQSSGVSSRSQSTSSPYSPGSFVYTKPITSPLGVGPTSGLGSYSQYPSSYQSKAGTQLAGSSQSTPVQAGSTSTDGSYLWLQGISSQYAPLKAKVYSPAAPSGTLSSVPVQSGSTLTDGSSLGPPVYRKTTPSGSRSTSKLPQWQTSSSWLQGFQTSGTVASQSSSPSQIFKAPSKLSTLGFAACPCKEKSGRFRGLSSLSQSTSTPYSSGPPAYAKHGSSLDFSSQSTSDPSSSGLYASSSLSMAGTPLAGSSSYVPAPTGTTFTDPSLQFQGTSQYAPSVFSQYTQSSSVSSTGSEAFQKQPLSASAWSQRFPATGTAVPQSSSQTSSVSSFLPALSPSVAQSSTSSSWRTSSFGTGPKPSKLSAQTASGSAISSQKYPGLSASVPQPSGSMTSSLGSSVQGSLQGILSGPSSDSASLISSSYGSTYSQKATGFSRPSQSSSATGRYSVKG